jgi:hypothetical protein
MRALEECMSAATVFFSWQSDTPTREGRNLIEGALRKALERIAEDISVDEAPRELRLDKDTQGVAGLPPVFDTILAKIDRAAVFVPDFTFVAHRQNGDPIPNANVLIEYGYALKSISHNRIVAVMNTAYGTPKRETMPFDLAHHRFPIQYDVPEGAPDDERRTQRDQLAKALESAIRAVLDSDAYTASIAPLEPPKYRQPLDGRARFRAKGEAIGFYSDPVFRFAGRPDSSLKLADGPATWLRVMPQQPVPAALKISDIQKLAGELSLVPLYKGYSGTFSVRGSDGAGVFPLPDSGLTPAIVFVFTDAEIWVIDTYALQDLPKLIPLDEDGYAKSLRYCANFLSERFGIGGPFHWVAGLEGVSGRLMPIPNDRLGRTRGPCATDLIEREGSFRLDDDPYDSLEPFFEEVCEQCGVKRPPRKPGTASSY